MSANINFNEQAGEYSFYSRKEIPWHKLGQFIDPAANAEEALKLAHLDYEVKTGPIYASFIPQDGYTFKGTYNGHFDPVTGLFEETKVKHYVYVKNADNTNDNDPNYICLKDRSFEYPDIRSIYRDDTKKIFGYVGSKYEVVQNHESLDMIYNIIKGPDVVDKNEIVIETAGALRDGETVFVTAKMPSYMIRVNGKEDVIDRYVVFTNSHNKSSKLCAIITPVRVVCNNTLRMALRSKDRITLKHTKNIREKFTSLAEVLGVANKYSQEAREVLEHIASIPVDVKMVNTYVAKVMFQTDRVKALEKYNMNPNNAPDSIIPLRSKRMFNDAMAYIESGAGQDIGRGTAYWMYNGLTSYYFNGKGYKDSGDKFDNMMDNGNTSNIIKSFKELMEYA